MKLFFHSLAAIFFSCMLFSCSENNVHVRNDWGQYFSANNVNGCFMLHDFRRNVFNIFNVQGTQVRHAPFNTFDIMNALAGIETGVISDTNLTVSDSAGKPFPDINPNLTMAQAFRQSNESYFSVMAQRIGQEKMDFWLDSVKYGNMDTNPYQSRFWMNNALQISPDEQMGFMENLYSSKLPFQSRTVRLVKALLLQEKTMNYSLYYQDGFKAGASSSEGWITGWLETNERPYFFVLYLHSTDKNEDLKSAGLNILHHILAKEGYLKRMM